MSDAPDRAALVAGFRRLRPVIHAWLARDLAGAPGLDPTRAYADLTLAFGFARLGAADETRACVADAESVLSGYPSEAHRWLRRLFRYRIDEALRGNRHGSLVPEDLRLPIEEINRLAGGLLNASIKHEEYAAKSLIGCSRLLDPFDLTDAFDWAVRDKGPGARWERELENESNLQRRVARIRDLIASGERMPQHERVRLWRIVFGYAATAGNEPVAELLIRLPSAVRPIRALAGGLDSPGGAVWGDTRRVLTVGFNCAATLPDPEHFPPLVDVFLELLRAAPDVRPRYPALTAVGWPLLRWFRATGERDAAALFLHDSRELWPSDAEAAIPTTNRIDNRLYDILRARLVQAVLKTFAGQPEALAAAFPSLLGLVTAVEHGGPPYDWEYRGSVLRFAAGCVSVLAFEFDTSTIDWLCELVERLPRVENTYTTARWYSRVHFELAEALVLAFPIVGDF